MSRRGSGTAAALVVALLVLALPGGALAADEDPGFTGAITPIPQHLLRDMPSWRPGCPVHHRDLRLLRVTYRDFAGARQQGKLVVHERWAGRVLGVMRELYAAGVRIERMDLADRFGADDQRMMRANDTSAFNCRYVAGTRRWSEHAFGEAIDFNPIQNPYVSGSHVSPALGRAFADRSRRHQGMVRPDDATVRAFRRIGWEWGGTWRGLKDYMHFSANGH